jgi:hypothetical protein
MYFVYVVKKYFDGLKQQTKKISPGGVVQVVVIISATGIEDRGFKSRQGVRFLGRYTLQCCPL